MIKDEGQWLAWERHVASLVVDNINITSQHIKNGDIVVDVGANFGMYTQGIVDKFPDTKVYAFEPVLYYYLVCRERFMHNMNVVCEPKALSHDNENKFISINPKNLGNNKILCDDDDPGDFETQEISCVTFSEYANENNITHVDFIKIDAEGHECYIIHGMQDFLCQANVLPFILFENNWYPRLEAHTVQHMQKEFGYKARKLRAEILLIPPRKG
jgi:FkbM family methyltransferase